MPKQIVTGSLEGHLLQISAFSFILIMLQSLVGHCRYTYTHCLEPRSRVPRSLGPRSDPRSRMIFDPRFPLGVKGHT